MNLCGVDALWRAITYVSVAQLHLADNVLLERPVSARDVKAFPAGHWGTVPGTAWVLAHLGLLTAPQGRDVVAVLGAGHAGVSQLALSWLTGRLYRLRPRLTVDRDGLTRLVRAFPDLDGFGAEVHPLLVAGDYQGGCLGGALAFAQGAALRSTDRLLVPVLGDGECETPTTAASWLAQARLGSAPVMPVVHLNGFAMGNPSLLSALGDDELAAYATAHRWRARIVDLHTPDLEAHLRFAEALQASAQDTLQGRPSVVFLRCVKGWGGPQVVDGRQVSGTAAMHKTPLLRAHQDPRQRQALQEWLSSYRPAELFDPQGRPAGELRSALAQACWPHLPRPEPPPRTAVPATARPRYETFADAVTDVLTAHAARGDFHLFSPDELTSNRLGHLAGAPWVSELLAEEVLTAWLAGWTASGRRGALISYEAFAPLSLGWLTTALKQRRLKDAPPPSITLLLTSYGWHNVYTHGDPSLATALMAHQDPAVRVLTPADPARTAAVLDRCLDSRGQVNLIIAGKHTRAAFPDATIDTELTHGLALWDQASDQGEPDLVIIMAGDLAAQVAVGALDHLRRRLRVRIRVINVLDLTALADCDLSHHLGADVPVLVLTLGHEAAVWGLLHPHLGPRPAHVIGWREPPGPSTQARLHAHLGMDTPGLLAAATRLLDKAHPCPNR